MATFARGSFLYVQPYPVTASNLLSSNVLENEHPLWDSVTHYHTLGERVIKNHKVYENIKTEGNTNKDPEADTTHWLYISVTNRFKMFDNQNSSQTVWPETIEVTASYAQRCTTLYFGNVEAQTITVNMMDSNDAVVFTTMVQMYENTGLPSYYSWFTARLMRKSDILIDGFPALANCKFQVVIDNGVEVAKCGVMLVGYASKLGDTQYGLQLGTDDYSVKRRNDFGDFEILERAFSRYAECNVFCDNSNIDRMINNLVNARANATLYVSTTEYEAGYIYGFYNNYSVGVQYPNHSILNIKVEGLT